MCIFKLIIIIIIYFFAFYRNLCLVCLFIKVDKLQFQNKIFEETDKMEEWLKITLCVSLFSTFRDFRPVDSFYASYLTSPAVNFTTQQVSFSITYTLLFLQ